VIANAVATEILRPAPDSALTIAAQRTATSTTCIKAASNAKVTQPSCSAMAERTNRSTWICRKMYQKHAAVTVVFTARMSRSRPLQRAPNLGVSISPAAISLPLTPRTIYRGSEARGEKGRSPRSAGRRVPIVNEPVLSRIWGRQAGYAFQPAWRDWDCTQRLRCSRPIIPLITPASASAGDRASTGAAASEPGSAIHPPRARARLSMDRRGITARRSLSTSRCRAF
jgi:hypothetical protein